MDEKPRFQPAGGASALGEVIPITSKLADLRRRQGAEPGTEDAEPVGVATGCIEQRIGKLSHYTLRAIETQAIAAARENRRPVDACPYRPDFAPREFFHWRAVFIKEGGTWE